MKVAVIGGFERPFGLRGLPGGDLVVCDLKSGVVSRVAEDGRRIWESPGWHGPHSAALGPDGRVYATEFYGRRLLRFDAGDGRCEVFASADPARPWLLAGPAGAEFDGEGRLIVGDYGSHSLQRFGPDGRLIDWLGGGADGWSSSGAPSGASKARGGFDRVHAALPMADGTLLAADTWNHRLQRFDASGRWLSEIAGFDAPVALAAWDGGFVTSEYGAPRLQRFDAGGRRLGWLGASGDGRAVAGWRDDEAPAVRGGDPGTFWRPYDVKSDGRRLLVADTDNGRVQAIRF